MSARYIFWRATETLNFSGTPELMLGPGLLLAEFYAILMLALGYFQTLWPSQRTPVSLPDDPLVWPTVDVFIPTCNEPLSTVRATVLGALAIDWPPGKMRVYILDDGRRPEFQAFADACGAGYLTRPGNLHAKAGNLNNAMQRTGGEFIAVFDHDHIPTRAFLQLTMGWMVHAPRNALVQTPLHCYSPDLFDRNLAAGRRVPGESSVFYGLVQDCNDFWNACLFCGSCAVLRRVALDEIGGFAIETSAENAHTTLNLHRRGWQSAYFRLPLAAGLATEGLMAHIGQRIRETRGMIQLFRTDNPLLGPGLTLGQRLCYLQAMGRGLFAIPRIVFLTAPLAYLLLDQTLIAASPLAIVSYALPHIFHAVATRSRLAGNHRHSFWSAIHDTVLALFLVRVTLATLCFPRRGKAKSIEATILPANGYFDLAAVYPNMILAVLLLLGIARGTICMIFLPAGQGALQALLLNTVWATISLLTVMAALAICRETRPVRARPKLHTAAPVAIHLPDGRSTPGTTRDLSVGGASIVAEQPDGLSGGMSCQLEFTVGGKPLLIPSQLVGWEQRVMQIRFQPETIAAETAVVQAVFGRADAWVDWADHPVDRPLVSLFQVLATIRGLFRPRDVPQPSSGRSATSQTRERQGGGPDPLVAPALRPGPHVANAAALLLALALAPAVAQAQASPPGGLVVRLASSPVFQFQQAQAWSGPLQWPVPALPVSQSASLPAATAPALPDATQALPTRRLVLTLRQLGASGPLALRGTNERQGVQFGIRADEVVAAAVLHVSGATSPALIPEVSNVTVTLNEQYVGTIPVNRDRPRFENLEMSISPLFFQDNNRLTFRFSGRYTTECNDALSGLLWSTISDASTLTLTLARQPAQRDLSRLPLPFFDPHENQPLTLPFVVLPGAMNETMEAAGIVGSWFGQQAGFRGVDFPVSADAPGDGNAVVFVSGQDRPGNVNLPPITGPTLAVLPNPADSRGSLLLVAGRDAGETLAAAQVLTLGARVLGAPVLGGELASVIAPELPFRKPYDAPAWIATDRPVKFGELVDASDLQATGFVPGALRVPFRTAPDLYTWRDRGFPMQLRFRAPPGPIVDLAVSRLDVGIDGLYLASIPLADDSPRTASWLSRVFSPGAAHPSSWVEIPAYDVAGQDDLQFLFDTRPLHRGDCAAIPQDLRMSVDPDSTLDLSRAYRFAAMPNLAYFVNSGFPFTRMADLSETVVVLPDRAAPIEVQAFLGLMGRFGAITGTPVTKLSVVRPGGVQAIGNRDVLLIGATAGLGDALSLLNGSPYRVDGNRLQIELGSTLDSVRGWFGDRAESDRTRATAKLATTVDSGASALVSVQSPLHAGRTVVALLGASPDSVEGLVTILRHADQARLIQGDLSLAAAGLVTSYRVGDVFTIGSLPFWLYPSWLLRTAPLTIVALMVVGCALLAVSYARMLRRRAAARDAARPIGPGLW